jgi:HK97 family phage prohead protease
MLISKSIITGAHATVRRRLQCTAQEAAKAGQAVEKRQNAEGKGGRVLSGMADACDKRQHVQMRPEDGQTIQKLMEVKGMGKELERRSYTFDVRASETDAGEQIITGRPIVYESRTELPWFDEIIDRGALDGADLTDVRFLVNHDTNMIPLARSRRNNGNSTMKLSVDYEGLNIDFVKLDTKNNADASALYSAVKRGDITGMSFAFSVDGEEWENLESDHPTRHITKIGTVVEVSAVTFPAYEATSISARSKEALDSARSALENARQQKAEPVDTGLELLKAKFLFETKI